MKILLLAAAAFLFQSPAVVIDCAQAVQAFNRVAPELKEAAQAYSQCLNADRLDTCADEFQQLEQAQVRHRETTQRIRAQCTDEQIRQLRSGG